MNKVLFTAQPATPTKVIAWIAFFAGIGCLFLAVFKFAVISIIINWNATSDAEVYRNTLFVSISSLFTLAEGITLFILFVGLRHMRRWALNLYTGFLIFTLCFIGFLFMEHMTQLMILDLVVLIPFALCWLYLWRRKALFT